MSEVNIGIRAADAGPVYEPDPAATPDPDNQWQQVTPAPQVPTLKEQEAAAAAAAETAAIPVDPPGLCTLSSGVRFKVRPVPPLLVRRAQAEIKRPVPPIWRNPANDREEPNEADPDYLRALEAFAETEAMAAIDALILIGTSLDALPDGLGGPETQEWLDVAGELGINLEFKTDRGRYLAWVKFVAIGDMHDLAKLGGAVGRLTGISEEDMARAIDSFRSGSQRGADNGADLPAVDQDGDHVPAADRGDGAGA